MNRVSQTQLLALATALSPRRWELLRAVDVLRLATGGQLRRRFYADATPSSAARLARLDLAAMFDAGILHRLDRHVGGRRAGSTGFVYAVGPVGLRLLKLDQGEGITGGRSRYEPTVGFVDHALAVTEIWVGLHEHFAAPWTAERDTRIDFRVERDAWRSHLDALGNVAILKPDAELHVTRQDFEDRWWLEVDRGTERRSVIRRKLDAYIAYFNTGHEQAKTEVFPLTAWLTTTEQRAAVLREVIADLPRAERHLFRVGLLSVATPFLLSSGRTPS